MPLHRCLRRSLGRMTSSLALIPSNHHATIKQPANHSIHPFTHHRHLRLNGHLLVRRLRTCQPQMSSANGDQQPVRLSLPLASYFEPRAVNTSANKRRNTSKISSRSFDKRMSLSSLRVVSASFDSLPTSSTPTMPRGTILY
jgi:hypothetical protein